MFKNEKPYKKNIKKKKNSLKYEIDKNYVIQKVKRAILCGYRDKFNRLLFLLIIIFYI